MPLVKERLHFLSDAPAMMRYLFEEPALPAKEEFIPKKLDAERARQLLAFCAEILPSCDLSRLEEAENRFRDEATRLGVKLGDLLMPLRVAVTGARVSPPLFESMRLIGVARTLDRIERARAHLV
jgi:glutamyl-tRNA synthetase